MSCITEPVIEPVSSIVAPLPALEASVYSLDRGVVMNRLRPFHSKRSKTASSRCCRTPSGSVDLASQEEPWEPRSTCLCRRLDSSGMWGMAEARAQDARYRDRLLIATCLWASPTRPRMQVGLSPISKFAP